MSVLVYAENWEGNFRKGTFEAVWYAKQTADLLDVELITFCSGNLEESELEKLAKFGSCKILTATGLEKFDSRSLSSVMNDIVNKYNVDTIIFSSTYTSKMTAPRLSIKINSGIVNNVISLPKSADCFQLKKKVFSGKAFELCEMSMSHKKIIMINPNSFSFTESQYDSSIVKESIESSSTEYIKVESKQKSSGKINLSEAEIIVSAGRGLKGPENWNMIEDLADLLGAATACSKPVSDIGWRPHSEHVGQTGKAVAPNLYIAIGISGAIQHLAGVNSSKTMVVINTDPEAPFFKAADYGIVGDAFDVVPKLIEEIKKIKN